MAVIQISKIQVRRGLHENLPQLASGEMGWSVDTQRLYIGNGTLAEGAPEVGNTEIVTTSRDILSIIRSYTFKGTESGYESVTGSDATHPILRKFQDKLDEYVSVKDFGAVGDGTTDDTAAIQKAIDQVYPASKFTTIATRRILDIPAGEYIISSNITIPSYAHIKGEGPMSSILKQTGGSNPLIQFKDENGLVGNAVTGTNPFQISITDIGLETTQDNHLIAIDSASDVRLEKMSFTGSVTFGGAGTEKAGIRIQDSVSKTEHISIKHCDFANVSYGIYGTGDIRSVTIDHSKFDHVFHGVVADKNSSNVAPTSMTVSNSIFSRISNYGVKSNDGSSITSTFNYFGEVGFSELAVESSVLYWGNNDNYSISDKFTRDDANIALYPIIEMEDNGRITSPTTSHYGSLNINPGAIETLSGNTAVAANTTISFDAVSSAIIDYTMVRNNETRMGSMKVTQTGGTAFFEDDYTESTALGVTLSFDSYGNVAVLQYTSTNTSPVQDTTFKFNIRNFV